MVRRPALCLAALVVSLGLGACGGDDDASEPNDTTTTVETTTTDETTDESVSAGREVFTDNCGSCHVLADAGTVGLVGPDLDRASLEVEAVEQRVREGGDEMPAFEGTLSDEEIEQVSRYVVAVQRG